jgi:hypothetical protein
VLGEYQTCWQTVLIAAAGVAVTTATVVRAFTLDDVPGLTWWRAALTILIVFDVTAGCVANLTPAQATTTRHGWGIRESDDRAGGAIPPR